MTFLLNIPVFKRLWPSKHNKYIVFVPTSFILRLFKTTPATCALKTKFLLSGKANLLVFLKLWHLQRKKVRCLACSDVVIVIVSTRSIRWILWFSVRYAAAAACREIFGINALRGKQQQLGSPNLQDIFIGG